MKLFSAASPWLREKAAAVFVRPSERYQALDGIRALSIIMIIVFHAWMGVSFLGREAFETFNTNIPSYLFWITKLDFAVDAFFVMSGFLIGNILLKELKRTQTIDLKQFYIKRLFRLYPAYLLLIALFSIAVVLSKTEGKPGYNLLFNLFYVSNFLPAAKMHIDWSWTLCVEEQFYILMPLILLLSRRYLSSTLVILLTLYVLSYIIRLLIMLHYPQLATSEYTLKPFEVFEDHDMLYIDVLDNNLHSRYGAIITGVIGAHLYTYYKEAIVAFFQASLFKNNLTLIAALAMIGLPCLAPTYRPSFYSQEHFIFNMAYHTVSRNIFSLGIMLLIFCSLFPRGFSIGAAKFLGSRVWFPVAQLSYSLYLFHLPFVALIVYVGLTQWIPRGEANIYHILILSLLSFFISCLFAILVFTFVERPFIVMRDRRYQAGSETAALAIQPTPH